MLCTGEAEQIRSGGVSMASRGLWCLAIGSLCALLGCSSEGDSTPSGSGDRPKASPESESCSEGCVVHPSGGSQSSCADYCLDNDSGWAACINYEAKDLYCNCSRQWTCACGELQYSKIAFTIVNNTSGTISADINATSSAFGGKQSNGGQQSNIYTISNDPDGRTGNDAGNLVIFSLEGVAGKGGYLFGNWVLTFWAGEYRWPDPDPPPYTNVTFTLACPDPAKDHYWCQISIGDGDPSQISNYTLYGDCPKVTSTAPVSSGGWF